MRARLLLRGAGGALILAALIGTVGSQAGPAVGDTSRWVSRGPYGGAVSALLTGLPIGYMLATHGGGVFTSGGGVGWTAASEGLTQSDVTSLLEAPGAILAGTANGVFRTTDYGLTWTASNSGLSLPTSVASLALVGGHVFALTTDDGLFLSDDGGATWTATAFTSSGFSMMAAFAGGVVVGRNHELYFSSDLGGHWSANILPQMVGGPSGLFALAVDPDAGTGGRLFIVGGNGYQALSTDSPGGAWVSYIGNFAGNGGTCIAPAGGPAVYVGMKDGYVLHIPGPEYQLVRTVINAQHGFDSDVSTITNLGSRMLVGTGEFGLFQGSYSAQTGEWTWSEDDDGLAATRLTSIAIDPGDATRIYAGGSSYSGVFRSVDSAATWSQEVSGMAREARDILCVAATGAVVYAGTSNHGLQRSVDGGATWNVISTDLPSDAYVTSLAIGPSGAPVWAGTGSGVWRGSLGGLSWTNVTSDLTSSSIYALAAHPVDAAVAYAGTYGGLFKTTSAGASWTRLAASTITGTVVAVALDPSDSQVVWAVTTNKVFRSGDGGGTFAQLQNAQFYGFGSLQSVAVGPDGTAYVGTHAAGVFAIGGAGATWTRLDAGLVNRDVTGLAVSPATGQVLAATAGGGVFSYGSGTAGGDVVQFLLPQSVDLTLPATGKAKPHPAGLEFAGVIDVGPDLPAATAAGHVEVGSRSYPFGTLTPAKKGRQLVYADEHLSVTLAAAGASSRRSLAFHVLDDLSGAVQRDGEVTVRYVSGDGADAAATVRLTAGKYRPAKPPGSMRSPVLAAESCSIRLADGAADTCTFVACIATDGSVPESLGDVTVGVRDRFTETIPGSSFKKKGTRFEYRGGASGVSRVTVDWHSELVTVQMRKVELGSLTAASPVVLVVRIGGDSRSVAVRLGPRGKLLVY